MIKMEAVPYLAVDLGALFPNFFLGAA